MKGRVTINLDDGGIITIEKATIVEFVQKVYPEYTENVGDNIKGEHIEKVNMSYKITIDALDVEIEYNNTKDEMLKTIRNNLNAIAKVLGV